MENAEESLDDLFTRIANGADLLNLFFLLLWQKSRGTKGTAHTLLNVHVPDTIVLNHSRALRWYFTAKDGAVKMKTRQRLNSTTILEHLAKHGKSVSKCVGVLMRPDPGCEEGIHFQSHTHSQVQHLLGEEMSTGMLQLFIDPKPEVAATNNSVIVANWTPNVFFAEKRVNSCRLDNEKIPLKERTTTEETSRFVRTAPLVSTRTSKQLENVCIEVARHIEVVHGYRVTNLVLHTKIDSNDTPWVLFCSTLRILSQESVHKSISVSVGSRAKWDQDKPQKTPPRSRSLVPIESSLVTCALCHSQVSSSTANNLSQKHVLFPLGVLGFYQENDYGTPYVDASDVALKPGDVVPQHVSLLHDNLTVAEYEEQKNTPEWQALPICVCSACTAGLMNLTRSIRVEPNGSIQRPFGKEGSALYIEMMGGVQRRTTQKVDVPKQLPPLPQKVFAPDSFDEGGLDMWEEASQSSDAAPLYQYKNGVASQVMVGSVIPRHLKDRRNDATPKVPKPSGKPRGAHPSRDELENALRRLSQWDSVDHTADPEERKLPPTPTPSELD